MNSNRIKKGTEVEGNVAKLKEDLKNISKRLTETEAELEAKDSELENFRQAIAKLPSNIKSDIALQIPQGTSKKSRSRKGSTAVLIQSYTPLTVDNTRRKIEDFCRDLIINNDHISKMEFRLRAAIEKGLKKSEHADASVKCFPTYVSELPSGKECGQFLALDLGGTNFRVVLMSIGTDNKFEMDSSVYAISKEIMTGSGEQLFDKIAESLSDFMKEKGVADQVIPLGFTFSFPCRQKGLVSGDLIKWTKGFSCSGVEGQDVVMLLRKAIAKRGDIKIDIAALLNDTTGCLMSCAWKNPKCRIGLIIGTGTNACYVEDVDKVELLGNEAKKIKSKQMIVNTEWGAFGDKGELDYIVTKWDRRVDEASINPGKQIFEKMISGMYMGEVVRQVLVDLVREGLIFDGQDTTVLMRKNGFETRYVSDIESDPVGNFVKCRAALAEMGMKNVSDEDCSALRYVCECVSRRAGFMVSAGITALLKKMDYRDVVVAIDGSVFRYHPHFPNIMKSRICQLMGVDYKFDLMLSVDGSGRGAALVAATLMGECQI